MTEWKEYKLKDITTKIGSGATPRGGSESYKDTGISLIRSQNIFDFKFSIGGLAFIDDEQAYKLRNVTVEENDVLLNITGDSVTRCCIVPTNILPARVNQHVSIIRANSKTLDYAFMFYMLQSMKEELLIQSEVGATRNALTKDMIETLVFNIPSISEQKNIAEVLMNVDDKINLLHQQNKTLEEFAQTLFRQWFIEETKNEWKEYEVRDFATHKKISIKPAQSPNDNFLHFSLPAFDTNKEPNIELGSDIKSNKYQVEPFSILMSKLNPKTPRVWDIYFEPIKNSICSTEFQVVQPNDKLLFPFLSTLLKSNKVTGELAMSASGTSGSHQRVKPEDIFNISFVTPSIEKMKEFSELLEPNYLKQMKNQNQIQTLENMRDTLLPKLISGEVRLRHE